MKHNYKPLTTFRGWSEEQRGWVYGYLARLMVSYRSEELYYAIFTGSYEVGDHGEHMDEKFEVIKDSIGIYTGIDDANGTPIFCGVDGALYGGDMMETKFEDDDIDFIVVFEDMSFRKKYKQWDETLENPILNELDIALLDLTVFSSQYEQHLKEKR